MILLKKKNKQIVLRNEVILIRRLIHLIVLLKKNIKCDWILIKDLSILNLYLILQLVCIPLTKVFKYLSIFINKYLNNKTNFLFVSLYKNITNLFSIKQRSFVLKHIQYIYLNLQTCLKLKVNNSLKPLLVNNNLIINIKTFCVVAINKNYLSNVPINHVFFKLQRNKRLSSQKFVMMMYPNISNSTILFTKRPVQFKLYNPQLFLLNKRMLTIQLCINNKQSFYYLINSHKYKIFSSNLQGKKCLYKPFNLIWIWIFKDPIIEKFINYIIKCVIK
jgi:hypothetical protein